MLHFFWDFLAFVFAISVLIAVHELGHFWMARHYNVMVERFSIGFGKVLWSYRDKYGTEYVISAIPLGGYVKILDDKLDTIIPENFHRAFSYKSIWQRAIIIIIGPIFNFIFAIFIYYLTFIVGIPNLKPIIHKVIPYSIAAQAKIFPGMELKSINGIETPDWDSALLQLINKVNTGEAIIDVMPFNSTRSEQKKLDLHNWQFKQNREDAILALGIIPIDLSIDPVIAKIRQESAAMKAGLQVGDKIIKINGQSICTWRLFFTKFQGDLDQPLQISIERQGSIINTNLRLDNYQTINEGKVESLANIIGIMPTITSLSTKYKINKTHNSFIALVQAIKKTYQLIKLTMTTLLKLIIGDIKLSNLSGPISIARGAIMSAKYGLVYYLMFLALISINLGVINMLPLPILDGGHLLFLIIEKLKGKPISKQAQELSYYISYIFLMLLISIALFNDFSRLVI